VSAWAKLGSFHIAYKDSMWLQWILSVHFEGSAMSSNTTAEPQVDKARQQLHLACG